MEANLHACCRCESKLHVHTVVTWRVKGPIKGEGWGCFVCQLPADGAMSVLCDLCADFCEKHGLDSVQWACAGRISDPGRVLRSALTEPFEHDMHYHPEEVERMLNGYVHPQQHHRKKWRKS